MLLGLVAVCAGLFLIFRDFLPWLQAKRTGVIRTRTARPQLVERASEPDRFDALTSNRLRASVPGLICLALGVCWLGWNSFAMYLEVAGG